MRERKSVRLRQHDYSQPGLYFITICTQGMEPYSGTIENGVVNYSEIGFMAVNYWNLISDHFKNIVLHEYSIMPNHIHGIIELVRSRHVVTLPSMVQNSFGPLRKESLAVIIGQYKAAVTRWCNKNHLSYFAWQSKYHDHIIRDRTELRRIINYIKNNPLKWKEDEYFTSVHNQ